jgi:hypothetical protein
VTTSGTNAFNLDLNDIIEEAFERCGVEVRTGYEHRTARRSLNLLTIEWANRGINLWTIEQGSIPLVQGQGTLANPFYTFVYWRLRRIQDAGTGTSTQDIPFRMLTCLVAGLAYYLSLKIPEAANRIEMLKMAYEEQWLLASSEDREKASLRLAPREMFY